MKVFSEEQAAQFKRDLTLHYTAVKLSRAKTMPSLKKLTGDSAKPASFKDIVAKLKAAPTFSPQD